MNSPKFTDISKLRYVKQSYLVDSAETSFVIPPENLDNRLVTLQIEDKPDDPVTTPLIVKLPQRLDGKITFLKLAIVVSAANPGQSQRIRQITFRRPTTMIGGYTNPIVYPNDLYTFEEQEFTEGGDSRYIYFETDAEGLWKLSPISNIYGPYSSVVDALNSLGPKVRFQGLTVAILNQDTGAPEEWWFKDGVSDENFVIKYPEVVLKSLLGSRYKGLYDATVNYAQKDVVSYENTLYIRNNYLLGEFGFVPTNQTAWSPFVLSDNVSTGEALIPVKAWGYITPRFQEIGNDLFSLLESNGAEPELFVTGCTEQEANGTYYLEENGLWLGPSGSIASIPDYTPAPNDQLSISYRIYGPQFNGNGFFTLQRVYMSSENGAILGIDLATTEELPFRADFDDLFGGSPTWAFLKDNFLNRYLDYWGFNPPWALEWSNGVVVDTPSADTVLPNALGATASQGSSPYAARLDHTHPTTGLATLQNGKILAAQLPSYVDDVLEYANAAARPVTGETGKIYVTLDNNKCWRWSGSAYIEVSPSPGTTDSLAEGSTNLYFTNARAKAVAHDNATTSVSGFMSDTDKTKLDGIQSGAEVNVNADWNATSGDAQILNKPILNRVTVTPSSIAGTTYTIPAGRNQRIDITGNILDGSTTTIRIANTGWRTGDFLLLNIGILLANTAGTRVIVTMQNKVVGPGDITLLDVTWGGNTPNYAIYYKYLTYIETGGSFAGSNSNWEDVGEVLVGTLPKNVTGGVPILNTGRFVDANLIQLPTSGGTNGTSGLPARSDHTHTKSQVGLSNVDNTSDADKPVSTLTQTALNAKQDTLVSGTNIKTINNESILGSGNIAISAGVALSGKTIYVDAGVGTDTRTGLSKYDITKPFLTIAAAVNASVTGDLVYVRAGTYSIPSQINLNLKGNMFFEAGATVNIPQDIVAFSYSQNSVPISILGYANFVLPSTIPAGNCGVLTMPSGNDTTAVQFECNSISGHTNTQATLFNCAAGVLSVDAQLIQMTTNFIFSNATVFNITGSGRVTSRVPFVYCGVFLNGQGGITGTPAQFNTDTWTLVTLKTAFDNAGMTISNMGTNFRIVNYSHAEVGARFSWTEDTAFEAHVFNGVRWISVENQPSMEFASSVGTTNNKLFSLQSSNIFKGSLTNSLSSSVPVNVVVQNSYATVPASANVTFKVGSFTVDPLVGNM